MSMQRNDVINFKEHEQPVNFENTAQTVSNDDSIEYRWPLQDANKQEIWQKLIDTGVLDADVELAKDSNSEFEDDFI